MGIVFPDQKIMSTYLLAFLWTCCIVGISIEALFPKAWWRKKLSLTLYLAMGWTAAAALPTISDRFPREALILLFLGGLGYTGGVPFFVRNNNLDHSIWHVFVMAGSIAHWYCIYTYILPLDGKWAPIASV
jgi:hemolysin III